MREDDEDAMAEAQNDLFFATQGMFELGLPVESEYLALVEEALGELPGEDVDKVDAKLAEMEWDDGEMPAHFRVLAQAVKTQRNVRAMPNQDQHSPEVAKWNREHRDVEVQLNWLAKPMTGSGTLNRAAATLPSLIPEEVSLLRPEDPQTAQREHTFERHVGLLLDDWSPERLVCLKYNLDSIAPSVDPLVQVRVGVISQQVTAVMEKHHVQEPEPERLMLKLANNAVDPHVLADWVQDGRVSQEDVETAFNGWSTHSLEQIVAFEARNPLKLGPLADLAESILRERKHDAFVPATADGAKSEVWRFFNGNEPEGVAPAAPATTADTARKAVDRYTTWGSRYSLGSVLNQTLRYLTLSEPARQFGNWVQHGHDRGLQYAVGATIKGLATITGGASAVVASVVTVAETIVANVVGTALRLFGGGALAVAGAGAKLVGLASPSANRAGDKIVGKAKGLVTGISMVNNTGKQQPIPPHMMQRAGNMALLARITGSTTADVRATKLPDGFSRAHRGIIPREILSLEGGGSGKATKLRFDEGTGLLSGDSWSGLKVGVFVEEDAQGNGIAYHLSFVGTQAGRNATYKSDAAQSFFGIEDSAFHDADVVVKAFVARYGADKIKLQGHSLGGGIAQWAGIRNSAGDHPVKVTCFNAAGLHINMRNRLGDSLIAKSDVEHFNTARDFLSQKAEGGRSPFLGAQVGRRYVIPESKGHSLRHHIEGLERLPAQAAKRHGLSLAQVREAGTIAPDAGPMTQLGHGAVNQVYRTTAILSDGSRFPGVYKKDDNGEHGIKNAAIRNVATSKLDQRLHLGVIAETHLVITGTEIGSVMAFIDNGLPPVHLGNTSFKVNAELAQVLRDDPELATDFALSKGFLGARVDGDKVTMINERQVDPDDESAGDESAGIDELPSLNALNFNDTGFWRDATRLQWLDALTGQRDRHAGNYFVSRDPKGSIRVTGIDNDLAFDAYLLDPDQRLSSEAPRLPKVIDAEAARALLALTPEQVADDCAGLSNAEIAAAQARLAVIQAKIRSFGPDSDEGLVLGADADWVNDDAVQRLLGVSEFENDTARKGTDYMMQQAATRSIVAREMAPFATTVRQGQRPPVLDPAELATFAARVALARAAAPADAQGVKP